MAVQKGKNEKLRQIIKMLYEYELRHNNRNYSDIYEKVICEYLEFFPSEDIDLNSDNFKNCYPDPDNSLTGLSFELAGRGLVTPKIISRAGISNFAFKLTSNGKALFENKEELEKQFPSVEDNFAFVVMSFSENKVLKDAYELGIKATIKKCGYNCIRVDEIEHNRRITDKVIECIKSAKFIIADLTEQRPNCYYELGFAHALEKEVIHLVKEGEVIHFDIKDYNFIVYSSITELAERLEERIINTIGKMDKE
ncbi:hypothetical protein [Clostridium beijerinckii]|uniref:Nucleoside 2-deoxyribosyltransferase n=1 Tax=Clostridium beijerinckii TaxID=1520 RepID=A0AAX0B7G3_CLOBE|nr:hypothetical protein [Clostridium beijerinckii]NRT90897.1 nucleoside 2-deoxyribosyltransferase [Clostridium beijerinckii]NYC70423.1 nucleoside 2-deoxyribosyltransferase [Clostridium beijerinckii]